MDAPVVSAPVGRARAIRSASPSASPAAAQTASQLRARVQASPCDRATKPGGRSQQSRCGRKSACGQGAAHHGDACAHRDHDVDRRMTGLLEPKLWQKVKTSLVRLASIPQRQSKRRKRERGNQARRARASVGTARPRREQCGGNDEAEMMEAMQKDGSAMFHARG